MIERNASTDRTEPVETTFGNAKPAAEKVNRKTKERLEVRQARRCTHMATTRWRQSKRWCVLTGWYPVAVATATFRSPRACRLHPPQQLPHQSPETPTTYLARHGPSRELDHLIRSLRRDVPTQRPNGAAAAGVLRAQGRRRDGVGAGRRDDGRRPAAGGGGPGARAGGAVLLAGVRRVARGGRRGGAAGAGLRGRRRRRAGVPRGLLGLPRVEGPLRVQRLDRAPEGLRGGAPPRHALHAAGRPPGPRPLRRHRAGRARAGRRRRAALPCARHQGDVPAAEPDDAAGVVHGRAAQPRGGPGGRERAGGAVRERAGDGLRARREQGQVAAQRPRGAAPREGGRRAGGRLGEEDRVRHRPVPALGRVPRHQVRPRGLRPERCAAGARRPALRPARQRLSSVTAAGRVRARWRWRCLPAAAAVRSGPA